MECVLAGSGGLLRFPQRRERSEAACLHTCGKLFGKLFLIVDIEFFRIFFAINSLWQALVGEKKNFSTLHSFAFQVARICPTSEYFRVVLLVFHNIIQ